MHDHNELRCNRCGKLCAKISSLKRHGYYCRSKPLLPPTSRKRCCEACTRAKIRCDATFPSCSSCVSRKIACQYAGRALPNLEYLSNGLDECLVLPDPVNTDIAFAGVLDPFVVDATSLVQTDINFNDLSTLGLEDNLNIPVAPDCTDRGLDLGCLGPKDVCSVTADRIYSKLVSPYSVQWRPPRVLGPRRRDTPEAKMATMMIAQIIASFPHMMTRKETFPPFIHPRCYEYTSGNQDLSEIMKNCMGLALMFDTKKKESDNVFWTALRVEQDKLYSQYQTYSNHELQAALQAILIYTTMRLINSRSDFDNIEIPLLHSLNTISAHLSRRIGMTDYKVTVDYREQHWQDWLFFESQRRLTTMARLMNMAFSMDRAFSCQGPEGFALLPLPSKKVVWEAQDEQHWGPDYDEWLFERSIHGLTDTGSLVRLRQTAKGIESQEVGWQKWYASQDVFGTLVMLASQLLK